MGKFARLTATEVSITDEGMYGLEGSVDSLECFGGGGKGGSSAPTPIYTPPPAAPAAEETATQDEAVTPEDELVKMKEAQKKGAKSLQIPIGGATTTDSTTVGTV